MRAWLEILDEHYWDDAGGGYFFTAADAPALITRTKTAQDNPNPSGNGVMVGVLARLYYLTGDDTYRTRAEKIVATFAGVGVMRTTAGDLAVISHRRHPLPDGSRD